MRGVASHLVTLCQGINGWEKRVSRKGAKEEGVEWREPTFFLSASLREVFLRAATGVFPGQRGGLAWRGEGGEGSRGDAEVGRLSVGL